MIKLFQFKFILLILSIILIFNPKIVHSKEPIDFIKEVTSEASSILVKNLDKETKILKLRELAEENVDIKGIGYYTLGKHRKTIDKSQNDTEIATKGRHDPCVGIRAVPVGEAMVACVLADHFLRNRAQIGS